MYIPERGLEKMLNTSCSLNQPMLEQYSEVVVRILVDLSNDQYLVSFPIPRQETLAKSETT